MAATQILPELKLADVSEDKNYDGAIVVISDLDNPAHIPLAYQTAIKSYREVDQSDSEAVIYCSDAPGKRIILVPTGPVTRDFDDVRRYADAAEKGVKRALSAGCKFPLIIGQDHVRYLLSKRVTHLGALQALYNPIECREAKPDLAKKVSKLGLLIDKAELGILMALETGRTVCRDIGGSDPERMSAPRVTTYVEEIFKGTCIKINVISDVAYFEKNYPLLAAVNRATAKVLRHTARVIHLEYVPDGKIDTTLMLVGKGITYDTGGMDVKAGGHMAGMHRDKCGAAAVAGFFQLLSLYKPKGLKVIGAMSMVRNSIGSEGYVADELITSRAGVRIRIGNTDAEGRMVMADVLCEMKEKAQKEVNPLLFTIATLTGHVIRAYGPNYTAIIDNGPAKKAGISQKIQEAGDISGDPFEISTLRKEDYDFHRGPSEYEDVLQCNNSPSSETSRGHMSPAAFLNLASGLDAHGCDSNTPIPYSHVDIAGSSGPFPGVPTGAPIVAMAHAFVFNRDSQN